MEFKKLSDVEVVAEPTESANVLIEENGVIKKAPKIAVGGGDEWDAVIDCGEGLPSDDSDTTLFIFKSGNFNALKSKWDKGKLPKVMIEFIDEYGYVFNHRVPSQSITYVNDDDSFLLNFIVADYNNTPTYAVKMGLNSDNTFYGVDRSAMHHLQ
jgi:hypothetical protein